MASDDLLYRTAYLHFIEGLPQKEVAARIGLSTPTVSRLIRQARETGLVQITLKDPLAHYFELEKQIAEACGLREVVIPRVEASASPSAARTAVAQQGADYLRQVVCDGDVIGLGWGRTVYEMIDVLDSSLQARVEWVALHGSLSNIPYDLDTAAIVRMIARRSGSKHYMINVEGILNSCRTAQAVLQESTVRTVFRVHKRVTVSVVGIGALYPEPTSTLVTAGYLTEQDQSLCRQAGAVGDIVLRMLDESGNECHTPLAARTISISLDDYRRIPRKIVLASGLSKMQAIQAALKGGLVDVLIVDPVLAERLLAGARSM